MPFERVGVYPGTFDPVTCGHKDIIQRASKLVDKLIIGVARNAGKNPIFTMEERADLLRADVAQMENHNGAEIEIRIFDKLLMHFAADCGANVIFRGLRAVSDFEYEFQMAGMNARLSPHIQTLFLPSSERYQFISSNFVKEISRLGGDVGTFVSPVVLARLNAHWAKVRAAQKD
jgi:pantetheine-phosphate adenylyltransferase